MDHLAKNEEVLKILGSKLDKRYKKAIINSADKSLIRAICEYLFEESKLAEITDKLGITDLIKTEAS